MSVICRLPARPVYRPQRSSSSHEPPSGLTRGWWRGWWRRSGFPGLKAAQALGRVLLFLAATGLVAPAFASSVYYINNRPDSGCSDGGPHSADRPWCSFGPVNRIRIFAPGDQILLARGGIWDQQLTLAGRGTAADPITLGAYGGGPNPKILRRQGISDICVLITDPSYWKISDLEVGQASVGILLHFTQLFNQSISISNIYAHDNKGIWAGYSPEYPVSRRVLDPFASSLNINLSAGILFNMAQYLTFSSAQYVLRDVQVRDLWGTDNVDSLAFDAEAATVDNQDGHNAIQDVTLDGLFIAGDRGHAASVYQKAGLGCSDSLRLLGMSNVTLMNSVVFEAAGCHTPTGTAAVILGRISGVRFVNNIFYGVPDSRSPDETAIDLEWSEDHVNLYGNLFAGNAGAGVEILNIHPGDHTSAIDFSSNTFFQNAYARRPGAASVWEDNKGRGYGVPAGRIDNNLYYEPHGVFFAGRNITSVTHLNDLATMGAANYAAEQFSSVQGKNQWRYMYEQGESNWTEMPQYSAAVEKGVWQGPEGQSISAFDLVAAACTGSCNTGGAARVWVAPRAGVVSVRGRVFRPAGTSDQAIAANINLVTGTAVKPIWPPSGGRQIVGPGDPDGVATDLDGIQVAAGDVIRFEVHANGTGPVQPVSWTPAIGYIRRR